MLSNKIVPDQTRAGNENRAHVGKAGIYNQMTPMPASGGPVGASSPGEMPGGILGAPLNPNPHGHVLHAQAPHVEHTLASDRRGHRDGLVTGNTGTHPTPGATGGAAPFARAALPTTLTGSNRGRMGNYLDKTRPPGR
jgi:hypothetical protein